MIFAHKEYNMKKFFTIVGLLFSVTIFAQEGNAVIDALKGGDAAKFTSYFAPKVDIKLPNKDEMANVDKAEGASAVKGFFADNNINGFDATSQREMGGTMYITGKLKNGNTSYNITVMLKNKEGSMSVITVRIN
jgi:hypothetical protein